MKIDLGNGLELQNPVITASGTFGYGDEYADLVNLDCLGAIILKGTTLNPREGNPYPRMAETPSGMLNAVGLQNKGVDFLIQYILPHIKDYGCKRILNISANSPEEYGLLASKIADRPEIDAIEVNISCPNVKQGGMAFGTTTEGAASVTRAVRRTYPGHVMVKLSPNVTDITTIARAAEDAGADSVSLTNTFMGMAIDVKKRKPILSTITGGLSGPCIRPIALRMVWQVAKVVKIPVVGLGGIMNTEDALQFIMAGASAIQVGTANFINPRVSEEIVDGLRAYLRDNSLPSLAAIRAII